MQHANVIAVKKPNKIGSAMVMGLGPVFSLAGEGGALIVPPLTELVLVGRVGPRTRVTVGPGKRSLPSRTVPFPSESVKGSAMERTAIKDGTSASSI